MPIKPLASLPAPSLNTFPDYPPRDDMQNALYLHSPGCLPVLSRHFGVPETTIVISEAPVGWNTGQRSGILIPDLLIAFAVDRATLIAQNGYAIDEQGKPPDFVLEVASHSTALRDDTSKRDGYAAYGVPEYWRFDPTGGAYHQVALAGDRLRGGAYHPIAIAGHSNGGYRGHSSVLGLDLCWEQGRLRWYDPAEGRYLLTLDEEAEGRLVAEQARDAERKARLVAEQARDAERKARLAAEAEAQLLREQLKRLRAE